MRTITADLSGPIQMPGKILNLILHQNAWHVLVEGQGPVRLRVLGKGYPPRPTRRRNQARRNRLMRQWKRKP